MSESSGYSTQVRPEVSGVPAEIARKLSTTSFENPTWHTDEDNQHTTPISCNISQTQYLFQRLHFEHTNIYEYI